MVPLLHTLYGARVATESQSYGEREEMKYAFEVQSYWMPDGGFWWTLRITTDTAQWTSGRSRLFIGGDGPPCTTREQAHNEMVRQMNALVKALGLKKEDIVL